MAGKTDPKSMLGMMMKVRSGQMGVTDAAAELGISREVYYKWEERALEAMLEALEGPEPGRPPEVLSAPAADALLAENRRLKKENELLHREMDLKEKAFQFRLERAESGKKKIGGKTQ